jgi:hypothetical protein
MTTYLAPIARVAPVIRQLLFASRQGNVDPIGVDRHQCIEQIGDIEADLDLFAGIGDLDLILGLFLIRIVGLKGEQVRAWR